MALVADIDHLSEAISHADGAGVHAGRPSRAYPVDPDRAAERTRIKTRALRSPDANIREPPDLLVAAFMRRMDLLSRAIYFAVLSALATAALLDSRFLGGALGIGHGAGRIVAAMFVAALTLLIVALVELARGIRPTSPYAPRMRRVVGRRVAAAISC